jgi:truncated hemoglobin YjbI
MGGTWSKRSAFLGGGALAGSVWRLSSTDLSEIIAEGFGGGIDISAFATWGNFEYADSWGKDFTSGAYTFVHFNILGATYARIDFMDDNHNHVAMFNGGGASLGSVFSAGRFYVGKAPSNSLPTNSQPKETTDNEMKKWVEDFKARVLEVVPEEDRQKITPERIEEIEKAAQNYMEKIKAVRLGMSPSFNF